MIFYHNLLGGSIGKNVSLYPCVGFHLTQMYMVPSLCESLQTGHNVH